MLASKVIGTFHSNSTFMITINLLSPSFKAMLRLEELWTPMEVLGTKAEGLKAATEETQANRVAIFILIDVFVVERKWPFEIYLGLGRNTWKVCIRTTGTYNRVVGVIMCFSKLMTSHTITETQRITASASYASSYSAVQIHTTRALLRDQQHYP